MYKCLFERVNETRRCKKDPYPASRVASIFPGLLSRKIEPDSVRSVKDPMKYLSNLDKILEDD